MLWPTLLCADGIGYATWQEMEWACCVQELSSLAVIHHCSPCLLCPPLSLPLPLSQSVLSLHIVYASTVLWTVNWPLFRGHITDFLTIYIQALAELDEWQQVSSIVADMYGGIERVPTSIMKIWWVLLYHIINQSTARPSVTDITHYSPGGQRHWIEFMINPAGASCLLHLVVTAESSVIDDMFTDLPACHFCQKILFDGFLKCVNKLTFVCIFANSMNLAVHYCEPVLICSCYALYHNDTITHYSKPIIDWSYLMFLYMFSYVTCFIYSLVFVFHI